MTADLATRYQQILDRITSSTAAAARPPGSVRLVAVSKRHSPEAVHEMANLGQDLFAESRLQEALAKIPLCPNRLQWHFIGHLQKNKIRKTLPLFSCLHGVDSLDLAAEIERISTEDGHRPAVLLEVNTSGESSKYGFPPEKLRESFESLLGLPRIEILGLMTMAPIVPRPEMARPYFARLRELRDSLETEFSVSLPELSMGMSDDFEQAILEGATLVRIGTALFGDHKTP